MKEAIGWRAWYTGGRVFSSNETAWRDLPDDGVLVVRVYLNDKTSRLMSGADYYFKTVDESGEQPIYGQGVFNPQETMQELAARYPGVAVKRGRWTTDGGMHWADSESIAAERL